MLIVRIWEGLGNQMFQYAYARKRMEEGIPVFLDLNKAYLEAFPTLRNNSLRENSIQKFNIIIPSIDVEGYKKYFYLENQTELQKKIYYLAKHGWWPYSFIEEESAFYSTKIAHVKGNVYLKGWFQDQKYFKEIRKELCREFTPKRKIKIPSELLKMIKSENSAAIHVRRGDYVRLGRTLPNAYYIQAKTILEKRIENPVFFIFSDDFQWVKKNIQWDGTTNIIYIDEVCKLEDYEQLFLMSRCHAQIISSSTFSWWAAWLNSHNDKMVIMPKKFIQWNPGYKMQNSILL